jgi:hypothetical protein
MRFISLTMSFKRFICVSIIFFSFVVSAQAQTGPGGIGKTDGTSNLKLWLNSASGTNSFTNGAAISSWADQSGSGYNAAQINSTNQPTYVSNSVNGQPALNFDGSNDRMEVPSFPLFTTSSSPVSMFVVFKATNVSSQRFLITQPQTNCSNSFELGYHTGSSFSSNLGLHNGCGNATVSENAAEANTYTILTTKVLSSGTAPTNIIMNKNGTALSMVTNAGGWASAVSYGTSAVNLVIGTRGVGDGQHFGTIAEVISYNMTLNTAQTTLVENYLNAKYNISISNDKYAQSTSTTYNKEVSGIGKESDGNHTSASSKGLSMTNSSYLDDNGDYFMFGYDNTATNTTTADLAAGFTNRWTRDWFFDKTDTGTANGDVIITFDYSDMGIGGTPSGDYALIYRSTTTGNFATVAGSPSISGDQVSFTVNASLLADGYYTLATITSLNADLSALSISSGALSLSFASGTTAYTANVNSSITSITVTPTQSDANATIEVQVNGSGYATVTTATASSALALSVGANTVDVKVTAADGISTKQYSIVVNREKANPIFTNFNDITKRYFDASYTILAPNSDSPVALVYTSSNLGVATINGTTVTIVGAGSSTITATQAADTNYNSGSISYVLTVLSVSVLTKNGGISATNLSYVDRNGKIGGTFGVDKNGNIIVVKLQVFYEDTDNDGYGDSNSTLAASAKPNGYVDNNLDCNDSDEIYDPYPPLGGGVSPWAYKFGAGIYPGAVEIGSDGIDQDCNGLDAINWYPDQDGDGYGNESILPIVSDVQPEGYVRGDGVGFGDCNDNDATVYFFSGNDIPDDGIDQDCDGYDLRTWYEDGDGDGYGNPDLKFLHNWQNANYVLNSSDCDDTPITGASIYPGATEIPDDGTDQDCDGFDLRSWYVDVDGDNYGDYHFQLLANTQPLGYVSNNVDCNDALLTGRSFNPDIVDIADDGIDQNCDGHDLKTWYEDADMDGFGNPNGTIFIANYKKNYVANNNDCDDNPITGATIYPGATEVPDDGIDQDCDNYDLKTWYKDLDGDNYGNSKVTTIYLNTKPAGYVNNSRDCDDTLETGASFNPDMLDIADDGIDQNCDGFDLQTWYFDADGDEYGNIDVLLYANLKPEGYELNHTDCKDDNKNINPGALEQPNDGIDQNCDGYDVKRWYIDRDEDGYGYFGEGYDIIIYSNEKPEGYVDNSLDCNDTPLNGASVNPNILEIPNDGIDQNCDNVDLMDWYIDADGDGYGDPNSTAILASFQSYNSSGYSTNNFDCDDTPITGATIYPGAKEILDDGIDQNCDEYDLKAWYNDSDGDSFGRISRFILDDNVDTGNNNDGEIFSNTQPTGTLGGVPLIYVNNKLDCNDLYFSGGSSIYPHAKEVLDDGIDQDCDGFDLKTWYQDLDNDGYGNSSVSIISNTQPEGYIKKNGDCDDDLITGVNVYPGADEIPDDGIDQDCDGIGPILTWYQDLDEDSYGNLDAATTAETRPDGYVSNSDDCNDTLEIGATIYPGAAEILEDGIDQDCDGFDLITWFEDLDRDGFGTENRIVNASANEQPLGYSENNTDCNDTLEIGASIYPGAPEIANDGIDQDCDNKDLLLWYQDLDLDGFGNPDITLAIINQIKPDGYVKNNTDCDDTVAN